MLKKITTNLKTFYEDGLYVLVNERPILHLKDVHTIEDAKNLLSTIDKETFEKYQLSFSKHSFESNLFESYVLAYNSNEKERFVTFLKRLNELMEEFEIRKISIGNDDNIVLKTDLDEVDLCSSCVDENTSECIDKIYEKI
jgi:hypothetical protein